MTKETISDNLREKVEKIMQEHSREVYLARLRRCGVIVGGENGNRNNK